MITTSEQKNSDDILDATGKKIEVGSVVESCYDDARLNTRGVVVLIASSAETLAFVGPLTVGDLVIDIGNGVTRVSNYYSKWKVVPAECLTYDERYRSWKARAFAYDLACGMSLTEAILMDGLCALVPEIAESMEEPGESRVFKVLELLQEHLTSLAAPGKNVERGIRYFRYEDPQSKFVAADVRFALVGKEVWVSSAAQPKWTLMGSARQFDVANHPLLEEFVATERLFE